MPDNKRVKSIDIGEDLAFQQTEWKFERIGWVAMAGLILLALIGLFGEGPVSAVTKSGPGGLQVSYERIDRQMNPSQLLLQLPPEAILEGEVHFWIDQGYLDKVHIQDISPAPDSVEVNEGRLLYTILSADSSQPVQIKMDIQMQETGLIAGQAGWVGGESISFSHFVFP